MISDFEEMLMWTSYRYAIGRKTYVSCLSYEIPQHYYKKLSKERREFIANDIRREIANHLICMPFSLTINRITHLLYKSVLKRLKIAFK